VRVTAEFFFLKICFLNPAFSRHERQKVGFGFCAKLYCEIRKTGAALTTQGTRVYKRGTGFGWSPFGATTGANEPHTHLGLVI